MPASSNPDDINAEFHPELISRRGEFIGWGAALLAVAAWALLLLLGKPIHPALPFVGIFLLLSALAISLGNWMDRRSLIRLELEAIWFQNGPRRVRMRWDEIQQVQVFPSAWGKKVRVLGEKAYFDFRMLGEVKVRGELKGRIGFAQGEMILGRILEKANLKEIERPGSGYYYVRQ